MGALGARVAAALDRDIHPAAREFAARLGREAGAVAVLFYGSNLRTGSLEGVLDFYVLLPGLPERGLWPRVSYREWRHGERTMRAKIATMSMAMFDRAAAGKTIDTTIWSRFVQPCAVAWSLHEIAGAEVLLALRKAAVTAARLAVALGPPEAREDEYWRGLFKATYSAEFRVEKPNREASILEAHAAHFDGLLAAALPEGGIAVEVREGVLRPETTEPERQRVLGWWRPRRRLAKPLNIARLLRATRTFEGAPRYAAWKIGRHTGVNIEVTPWRERHPVLAAPGIAWQVWRNRRGG